ncbi:MAG: hypothetical protein O9340_12585 [Cyclobacteriaceae bacterium]|jgi:hypothetical protein|nr:hypothetical protein [Cyclobacteriaceae bacterium]
MKKIFILLLLGFSLQTYAQDFGLSFSYFIPRNGEFSTPVSPFSLRGVGVSLNNYVSIETGVSLYRMAGLGVVDLPFETDRAIVGPNFNLMVPVELVFTLKGNRLQFDVKGGGFGFVTFDNRINYGHLDRALLEFTQWQSLNSSATFSSSPGFGWMSGAELTIYFTQQFGLSFEANYLASTARFPIEGSYTGSNNNVVTTENFNFSEAKMDFTGMEFSIGLIFSNGGGGNKPKRRR